MIPGIVLFSDVWYRIRIERRMVTRRCEEASWSSVPLVKVIGKLLELGKNRNK
jgi:hypothetical protein